MRPSELAQRLSVQALTLAACLAVVVVWAMGLVDFGSGRLGSLPYAAMATAAISVVSLARTARELGSEEARSALAAPLLAPGAVASEPTALDELSDFQVHQRLTAFQNRYEVRAPDGRLLAFVEQKRLALKEHLTAWADEDKSAVVFTIRALTVIDLGGRYLVEDAEGRMIGGLEKLFGRSLVRSSWRVTTSAAELVATVEERSLIVALWRRIIGFVPVVGDLLELVPVRFHFDLRAPDGRPLGSLTRRFGLRDRYDLHLDDPGATLDRRLAMALGVALDALQDR